jgi:two-component sensor histidine kinase
MFRSTADARNHLRAGRETLPWISDEVLPVSGAARQARNVATDACLRWDLPHLVGPASLIVSELVSNVVDHAHTMADIRISLRRRYLTIAVRDGASAPPVASDPIPAGDISAGRGLLLVDATAHSWGWLPSEGGKVVWAALAR